MNRAVLAMIISAAMMIPVTSSPAAIQIMAAPLQGIQEVPPNASPGTGFAQITVDDIHFTMRVEATFSGLIGTTTAAHIHCCAPAGSNASVATQTPSFIGFPLGVQSGTYDQTFDMTSASSYRAGFLTEQGGSISAAFATLTTAMATGNAYFNIHTSEFGGGEIRGQLSAVPEPASWAMMLLGLGAVGLTIRRRRPVPVAA